MPGLLEGQLASAIYAGFKGKLKKGVLRKAEPAASGGLDQLGDPIASDPATFDCQGFTEGYSDYFRRTAGVPETDLKVNIFAKSLAAGIAPGKDDKVEMPKGSGSWYQLRRADTDPAGALWVCPAYACKAPA